MHAEKIGGLSGMPGAEEQPPRFDSIVLIKPLGCVVLVENLIIQPLNLAVIVKILLNFGRRILVPIHVDAERDARRIQGCPVQQSRHVLTHEAKIQAVDFLAGMKLFKGVTDGSRSPFPVTVAPCSFNSLNIVGEWKVEATQGFNFILRRPASSLQEA